MVRHVSLRAAVQASHHALLLIALRSTLPSFAVCNDLDLLPALERNIISDFINRQPQLEITQYYSNGGFSKLGYMDVLTSAIEV